MSADAPRPVTVREWFRLLELRGAPRPESIVQGFLRRPRSLRETDAAIAAGATRWIPLDGSGEAIRYHGAVMVETRERYPLQFDASAFSAAVDAYQQRCIDAMLRPLSPAPASSNADDVPPAE